MKIHIFLLVLNLIQLCFSSHTNLTNDNEYPACPISAFRGKRALTEYTRWRANQVTKQEFIVKVDDDILSPNKALPNQVLAINVLPVTKAAEKIIINGVINPTAQVPGPTADAPLEYTRFVPPTTVKVTQVDDDLYLAPVKSQGMQLIKGVSRNRPPFPALAKHPDRDESPPARPQFIERSPALLARQYAPVTPVAFYPRTGPLPLTPPTEAIPRRTAFHPSRTSILRDIETPMRTDSTSILDIFQPVVEDVNALDSLLAPLEHEDKHSEDTQRVESQPGLTDQDLDRTEAATETSKPTRIEWNEVDEALLKKETSTTNSDAVYHMMYYNEEDNEISTTKKVDQDSNGRRRNYGEDSYLLKNDSEEELSRTENIDSENYVEPVTSDDLSSSRKSNAGNGFIDNTTSTNMEANDEEFNSLDSFRGKRRPACNLLKLRQLSFHSPRTLPEIVAQLKRWTDDSPIAKWIDITDENYTTMENPIYMMIIDDPSSGQIVSAKQTVLIVAGIQGRDHHAVAAAMYVLHQLIERSDAHTDLLSKYRFWIIPVFNPDGYDYSMTFPHRREWTKNLRQSWESCKGRESCSACEAYGLRCTVQPCYGVNLDRNFEYQWIPPEELRAEHPCGDLYAGTRQLSEHETRALTRFLHEQRAPLHTFVAFKEGDVLGVLYPYSHTRKKRLHDNLYKQRASRAASAAYSISGRPYVAGQTSEFLPLYAGGVEDWVDGHLGIDNTYTIMMFRPSDTYKENLLTERVVHEAYAALDTLLLHSFEAPNLRLKIARAAATAPAPAAPAAPAAAAAALVLAALTLSS